MSHRGEKERAGGGKHERVKVGMLLIVRNSFGEAAMNSEFWFSCNQSVAC